jgi:hypothetical protein
MHTLKQAVGLLQETEAKLRGLLSTAATSGDYATVVRVAAWARTLSEMVNGMSVEPRSPAAVRETTPQRKGGAGITASNAKQASKYPQKAYPVFFRQGDQVIRLAWSKREKKEYRHKAPHSALRALAKAMAESGAEGRVFSTDQFLPIHDAAGGVIPNYQAYVGISLLKQTGLIDQHGRQGYSIARMAEFKDAIESIWKKLPEL